MCWALLHMRHVVGKKRLLEVANGFAHFLTAGSLEGRRDAIDQMLSGSAWIAFLDFFAESRDAFLEDFSFRFVGLQDAIDILAESFVVTFVYQGEDRRA